MTDQVEDAAQAPASAERWRKIYFPIRLAIENEHFRDFTGDVAGIPFEHGISRLVSYREARQFTLAFKVVEEETGIPLSPITEVVLWRVGGDTDRWSPIINGKLDDEVVKREDELGKLTMAERFARVAALVGWDAPAEVEQQEPEPQKQVTQPEPTVTTQSEAATHGGASETAQMTIDLSQAPSAPPADAVPLATPKVPADPAVALELFAKMNDTYGARFIRQICERYDLKTARSGMTMVETLASHPFSLEEIMAMKPEGDRDLAIRRGDRPKDTQNQVAGPNAGA